MSFRGLTFEKSLKAFPTPRGVAQEPLPDALRMADTLERMSLSTRWDKEAAAELRRLHEENERLKAQPAAWVDLTDDERKKLCGDGINGKVFQEISKMVEAKLREKNGGKL